MSPSIDPSQWTYTDYVCFLRSHGFHNLGVLDEYLQWGASAKTSPHIKQPQASRTFLLEFAQRTTQISELLNLADIRRSIHYWSKAKGNKDHTVETNNRIILVENISPAIIDTLGGTLNLEPSFFASHLEDIALTAYSDAATAPGLSSTALRDQKNFFTIEYVSAFLPAGCPKEVEGVSLQCSGNYNRRIELIHKQGRQKVALARRKISFCMKRVEQSWLCIVLVDPPLSSFTLGNTSFSLATPSQKFEILGFQGGYLDFIEMQKPISREHHDFRDCRSRSKPTSPFDDLVRHWQIQVRKGLLESDDLNVVTIMKPAFQIAASEFANSMEYIRTTIESQHLSIMLNSTDVYRIKRNLDRCIFVDILLSQYKPILTRIKDYVHRNTDLKEDFRGLLSTLSHHRTNCDSRMHHITATLQNHERLQIENLHDEAVRRADYMRYLTIIALIYAPFALACAIFSLPGQFVPASHYLYGFLPVTALVTVIFVFLVLPESRDALPDIKAAFCGKLSRKKLVAKNRPESKHGFNGYGGEEV